MNFNLFSCRFIKATLFLALMFFVSLAISSCGDDKPANTTDNVTTTVGANSAQGQIVHHYICPNNCAGSGGPAAGNCPVCGSVYTHNDAWHQLPENQTQNQITPNITNDDQQVIDFKNQMNAPSLPQDAPATSPAQNAKGEWHYTCSAGCSGGAGAMGNCAKCGAALVHNSKYHE